MNLNDFQKRKMRALISAEADLRDQAKGLMARRDVVYDSIAEVDRQMKNAKEGWEMAKNSEAAEAFRSRFDGHARDSVELKSSADALNSRLEALSSTLQQASGFLRNLLQYAGVNGELLRRPGVEMNISRPGGSSVVDGDKIFVPVQAPQFLAGVSPGEAFR